MPTKTKEIKEKTSKKKGIKVRVTKTDSPKRKTNVISKGVVVPQEEQNEIVQDTSVVVAEEVLDPTERATGGEEEVKVDTENYTPALGVGDIPQASFPQEKEKTEEGSQLLPAERKSLALGVYRKIAYSFILLTFLLLVAVFYFSFVKVNIIIVPNKKLVRDQLVVDVRGAGQAASGGAINGVIEAIEVEATNEYNSTGAEVIGEEAVGKVTIFNNYDKNQPLVATTRLLTGDGKLFRIKNTVNVPAGGSVEADVYADDPSPEMAVGPTRFTIPGLWAGLQDKIYAENKETIVYKQKLKKYVLQSDIDAGVGDLKNILIAKAKTDVGAKYKDYNQVIYQIDESSIVVSTEGKVGEERDFFFAGIKTSVAVIAFNDENVVNLAKEKIMNLTPEKSELDNFSASDITYTLNSFNLSQAIASVKADFVGEITLKTDVDLIDRNMIVGLTDEQLNDYLKSFPEIQSFDVKFYPAFIRKVPRLADKINIEIKN